LIVETTFRISGSIKIYFSPDLSTEFLYDYLFYIGNLIGRNLFLSKILF